MFAEATFPELQKIDSNNITLRKKKVNTNKIMVLEDKTYELQD